MSLHGQTIDERYEKVRDIDSLSYEEVRLKLVKSIHLIKPNDVKHYEFLRKESAKYFLSEIATYTDNRSAFMVFTPPNFKYKESFLMPEVFARYLLKSIEEMES